MKYLFLLLLSLGLTSSSYCEEYFSSNTSEVKFFSWAPMEDIEAVNTESKSFLKIEDNSIVVRVPIKDFVFHKALMQEHFNENYMESDEFPNASFSGVIVGEYNPSKDGVYPIKAKGEFTLHGVKVEREFEGTFTVKASV